MKEIEKTLNDIIDDNIDISECESMREAAARFAGYCIKMHTGKMLDAGLKVASAISNYLNLLEGK